MIPRNVAVGMLPRMSKQDWFLFYQVLLCEILCILISGRGERKNLPCNNIFKTWSLKTGLPNIHRVTFLSFSRHRLIFKIISAHFSNLISLKASLYTPRISKYCQPSSQIDTFGHKNLIAISCLRSADGLNTSSVRWATSWVQFTFVASKSSTRQPARSRGYRTDRVTS